RHVGHALVGAASTRASTLRQLLEHDSAWHLLVKEVLDTADSDVVAEASDEGVIEQQVAYAHQGHAVVMGHERAHHRWSTVRRRACGCEVECFVEAVQTERSEFGELREVRQRPPG